MKKVTKKLTAVIVYLFLLYYLIGKDVIQIFDLKLISMFLLGCIVLCLPYLEKKINLWEIKLIFSKNAIMAGYLQAFILLFVSLQQKELAQDERLSRLALDLRPVFYGFVCYIVCREEEKSDEKRSKRKSMIIEAQREETVLQSEGKTDEVQAASDKLDLSTLTKRERQIAELVKRGLSNREIGEELYISETTVKKHISHIFEKLGIESRKDLK